MRGEKDVVVSASALTLGEFSVSMNQLLFKNQLTVQLKAQVQILWPVARSADSYWHMCQLYHSLRKIKLLQVLYIFTEEVALTGSFLR